jgi:hypothetical protein
VCRWHQRCRWENFGTFPFRGQLSGEPLPASTFLSVVPKSEHKGAWKTQFALEVSVVVISRPAGRSSFRPKQQSVFRATTGLKEVRATLEVDGIERKSK